MDRMLSQAGFCEYRHVPGIHGQDVMQAGIYGQDYMASRMVSQAGWYSKQDVDASRMLSKHKVIASMNIIGRMLCKHAFVNTNMYMEVFIRY